MQGRSPQTGFAGCKPTMNNTTHHIFSKDQGYGP
jgi:hypothetical protein